MEIGEGVERHADDHRGHQVYRNQGNGKHISVAMKPEQQEAREQGDEGEPNRYDVDAPVRRSAWREVRDTRIRPGVGRVAVGEPDLLCESVHSSLSAFSFSSLGWLSFG